MLKKAMFATALIVCTSAVVFSVPSQDDCIRLSPYQREQERLIHNDWPFLARYREANAKLGAPTAGERRVVFLGDSITEVWASKDPRYFTGERVNRGIGSQTTPQMLVRFRQDVIALRPKVVLILAGTNDIAGNTGPATVEMIEDNLASMAELAKLHGIRVVMCSVLPVYDYAWRPGLQPAGKIRQLNAWVKQYAAKNGHIYLDYYSAVVDARGGMKAELAPDGVHPNDAGYAVMKPLAEKAIARALAAR